MDMTFQDMRDFTAVCMDDVVVFSGTLAEHLVKVDLVLQRLREAKFYAKRSKCDFASEEIGFVGFRVSAKVVRTQPEKIEALVKFPIPKDVADIRSFTGFTNFHQKFVPNYANIVAPLSAILRKDVEWTWGNAQQKAFETVIQKLTHSTTLAYPDVGRPFHVHTDASDSAIGATMSQEYWKGEMRLLACMSKKLNAAECNYHAHEMEVLALVEALKHWRAYLWGVQVKAYTDSSFLHFLKTCELNSPRQVRWVSLINTYNVEIMHIHGTTNTAADSLSRLKGDINPLLPITATDDWRQQYE